MTLSFSDTISILAIIISLATFFVSIYFQFIKSPKLINSLGEGLLLAYTYDERLIIRSNHAFFNLGARFLGIIKIKGELTRISDGFKAEFEWREFFKVETIDLKDGSQKTQTKTVEQLNTIIIPGYQAVNQSVTFCTKKPIDITQGNYKLEYFVYTIPLTQRPASASYAFRIEKGDSEFLRRSCKANEKGVYKESLKLNLNP